MKVRKLVGRLLVCGKNMGNGKAEVLYKQAKRRLGWLTDGPSVRLLQDNMGMSGVMVS